MFECGSFFNPHRWNHLSDAHRICKRCGECEERFVGWWLHSTLNAVIDGAKESDTNRERRRKDREKALEHLRSLASKAI